MPTTVRPGQLTSLLAIAVPLLVGFPVIGSRVFFDRSPVVAQEWIFLFGLVLLGGAILFRIRRGQPSRAVAAAFVSGQLAVPALIMPYPLLSGFAVLLTACTLLVVLPAPWDRISFLVVAAGACLFLVPAYPEVVLQAVPAGLVASIALFATIRAAELAQRLARNRHALARLAVAEERLRVARDLHDSLGQELTAAGLRAELAARLTAIDPAAAAEQLLAVQRATERALDGVRQVATGLWRPEFDEELERGTALLEAAGVRAELRLRAAAPPGASWALREAITNVLKHSTARRCVVTTEEKDGMFRLTVDNDGAHASPGSPGSGLTGLTDRITALGGRVRAGPAAGRRFRLLVELPVTR
ncbi:histidine kinase [Crossiella sp. CA-258035]|uniref:sensor histidine kinase n=1 Tax=Crossiella sp. CA-258035 TaxID=2981138 RepID=UPI0024BD23B0|nr:histidine kinase [Crossiella sp. CA-258035]WHT17326.1 histidine kinase [Crossiella sp. CA-258035]